MDVSVTLIICIIIVIMMTDAELNLLTITVRNFVRYRCIVSSITTLVLHSYELFILIYSLLTADASKYIKHKQDKWKEALTDMSLGMHQSDRVTTPGLCVSFSPHSRAGTERFLVDFKCSNLAQ